MTSLIETSSRSPSLLSVRNLAVYVNTDSKGTVRAVDGVSFDLGQGEILGIVGESGSGKSVLCQSLMGLAPQPSGHIARGEVLFQGRDLLKLGPKELRKIRGAEIAMILQDPMTSLNPCFTIGYQIAESVSLHQGLRGADRTEKVVEALERVRIRAARERQANYPHQLSGGMRQRVCGAIAISCQPKVLIADEPTTSLDVTIEAEYLSLLVRLRDELGLSIILVTHDLGVVTRICDRVGVMYAGRIVEFGPIRAVMETPSHPYTIALFESLPSFDAVGRISSIKGMPPDPANFPTGCRFAQRCGRAGDRCFDEYPEVGVVGPTHVAACWYPGPSNNN